MKEKNMVTFIKNNEAWWHRWLNSLKNGNFDIAEGMVIGIYYSDNIDSKVFRVLHGYVFYKEFFNGEITPTEYIHRRRKFM